MRHFRILCVVGVLTSGAPIAYAQTPFRHSGGDAKHGTYSSLPGEHIDPASGALTLVATDLVLPGNAGFHLRVTRVYNSSVFPEYDTGSTELDEDSSAGIGWRLHFGRVINPYATTGGATSIELGDGSRHPLHSTTAYPEGWMSPGFARYDRANHTLKLPNGYIYTFGHEANLGGKLGVVRYVTEIRDAFNNKIEFSYFAAPGPVDAVSQIRQYLSPTQVRYVDFTYDSALNSLKTMSYGGRTWLYLHDPRGSAGHSVLREVRPPIGPSERYDYTALPGELTRYETTAGGVVTYTYQDAYRKAATLTNRTRVVTRRVTSGRLVTGGTWTFAYGTGPNEDTTVVSCACGTTSYRFNGTGLSGNFSAWMSGTIAEQTVAEPNGGPVLERRTFTWARSEPISPDPVIGENGVWSDPAVYTALLLSETITRGPQSWTTSHEYHSTNFNDFGQPWKTSYTGDFTRTVERTFQSGFGPHIVGAIASTWTRVGVEGIGATWGYDLATGFLTSYVGPQSPLRRFTPRSDGNLASEKDALDNVTTYENYSWGKPQIIRTPKTRTDLVINDDGTVSYGGNAVVVHYLYDALFRQTKTWSFGVNPVFTRYDNVAATTAWSERNGIVLGGVDVDGFGRAISTSAGPAGVTVRTELDACGRPVFTSVPFTIGPENVGTTTAYDFLGRVSTVTGPDGALTRFTYSGIDVTVTDGEGRQTVYDYAAAGSPAAPRLMSVRDAANVITSYTYDVLDSLVKVSGPGPVPDRTWAYDSMGRLLSDTQPESGTTTYVHDAAGNLTRKTDAKGQIVNFTYDEDNRLKTVDPPGTADDLTITYDVHGRLIAQTTPSTGMTFTYHTAGQLASRTDTVGALAFTSTYEYDANENLTKITYPSGRVVTYDYDAHNRLIAVRQNGVVFADQFTYDTGGRLASYRTGTVTHTLSYDAAGRTRTVTSGSALNLTYGYDLVGNVSTITDPTQVTQQFGYDALNRLTSASGPWGQRSWQYHPSGDRLLETGAGTTQYQYDAATRRLMSTSGARTESFSYNAAGEMTADGRGTYQYNVSGLVTQFIGPNVSAAYVYDPAGLRIAKTVNGLTTYTVRSSGGSVLSEYRTACGTTVWTRDIIHAGGRLLGSIKAVQGEPTVTLSSGATVSEAVGTMSATITLTTPGGGPLACPVTVSYSATGGTAGAGADYQVSTGSVTFNPGDPNGATRTVSIAILNDTLDEADETFAFTLAGITGGVAGANTRADITITDDDAYPSLSISDVTLYEGNAALNSAVFTVTLSAASGRQVYVAYATSDGSGLAGSDYQSTSGVLGFSPGITSMSVIVPVFGDGTVEPTESFQVTLSAPSQATLGDAFGIGTILNDDAPRSTWGDFYAPRDGAADAALFNPATALWTFKDSNTGNTTTFGPFGTSGDQLVPADYTGDGITDCAVYRPSTGYWFIQPSCGATGQYSVGWGGDPSDIPVPADYDGDGKADIAVYRRGTAWWHIVLSTGGFRHVEHGWAWTHSIPVPGDYDGDGRADFAFYADFNAAWVILSSSTGTAPIIEWGIAGGGVIPVPADYDGDGRTDVAYLNPSTAGWHIIPSTTGVGQVTGFGVANQIPVPADYDGDGKFDIAFYHPPDRSLWIRRSSTGTALGLSLWSVGQSGALPVLRKPQ